LAAPGISIAAVGNDPPSPARIGFPADSDHLLIAFSLNHDELAENDPTPLLRVYGDGAVQVHIPRYMRGAGDFRMKLDGQALRSLVDALHRQGVLGFDREQVVERRRQAETARFAREQTYLNISDTTWTTLRVHLDLYDPLGTGLISEGLDREIVWPNVAWQAEQYPEVVALQGLAAAERTLRTLLADEKLTAFEPREE
jgi:hypothetical protein